MAVEDHALFQALAAHDAQTARHSRRVARLAVSIGRQLGVAAAELDRLRHAALLHDLGKVRIPARLLQKSGRLTLFDWDVLRRHPLDGLRLAQALAPALGPWIFAISQHHERWDGHGYPGRLGGAAISLGARIVAVADSYEAITARRPYSGGTPASHARSEVQCNAGTQFDPAIVEVFLDMPRAVIEEGAGDED